MKSWICMRASCAASTQDDGSCFSAFSEGATCGERTHATNTKLTRIGRPFSMSEREAQDRAVFKSRRCLGEPENL